MAQTILMPRMGQGMDEGRVVRWLKAVGSPVRKGEAIVEIETDKANIEIDAPADGVVAAILVGEDAIAPVGTAIGLLDVAGIEPVAAAPASPAPSATDAGARPAPPAAAAPAAAAPPARDNPPRANASPLARRLAAEQQIDLAQVTGSGPGGRIGKEDVLAYVARRAPTPVAPPAPPATLPGQAIPLSKMRQAIARRMAESKREAPHFYVSMDVEMGRALALRDSLKQRGQEVGLNAILLKAAALALGQHPALNATLADEAVTQHPSIDLAIAVALDDGLLTPVVHNCEARSLSDLARAANDVITRARAGRLQPADLEGGTFTVTNLGMFGVRHFEAIVNPPQVAILALGAVRREPRFDAQERVIAAHLLTATLSADHRATDGAEAARFLRTFRVLLQDGFALLS